MNCFNFLKINFCSCHRSLLFALLLFSSLAVHAQPFLWQVTGEHEFYMFGTIHLPDPRVTSLSEKVVQALEDSNVFYAELDLSEENTMLIKQSMWLPEGKNLYSFLPEELQAKISKYIKEINPELNLEFFSKQKIWVLAITLTVLEQQLKYPGQPPLDTVLYERAVSLGLDTGGLETVDEQLKVFDSMTSEQQIEFLNDTVDFMNSTMGNEQPFIEESLNAYIDGDLDVLMEHLMSYMKDNAFYDDLLDRLINQRNIKMANKILNLISEEPEKKYFFAVGAGHFWGEKGINTILEEKGYTIKSIE